jgi:phospholipid/cholesterol/gamma-HCH transport system substrate-binding protein
MLREGSVGLLIIFGVLVFAGLSVWLKGLEIAKNAYSFNVQFTNANNMKKGAAVRYRGFEVGKIIDVDPGPNGVNVTVEITAPNLKIPKDALIEANQAGLIGETSIDIMPRIDLPSEAQNLQPSSESCNPEVIICANDQLNGQIGVSFDLLLRSTSKLTDLYTDPVFFANLNNTAKNAGIAAGEIAALSKELTLLSKAVRNEIKTFSTAANSITEVADKTSDQLTVTVDKIDTTVEQFGDTAQEINLLTKNLNGLVSENRNNIQATLNNISNSSRTLSDTSKKLDTLLTTSNETMIKVNQTLDQVDLEKTVENLEVLTANAAEASANLRDISKSVNDPNNIVLLQQTLDAARVTFENAQKITSDLDQLTGDPQFRINLLNLVNGLSKLVSSAENLETQIKTAQVLESLIAQKEIVKNTDKIKQK